MIDPAYEIVVGLETHVQLDLQSKVFASEAMTFGQSPNHSTSPVSLALPGTLPVLNQRHVEYAIRLGLALGCTITREFYFDRKNYFYADLPKGYQITQDKTPICAGGTVTIFDGNEKKVIALHHIHMEEDAGKSIHDLDPDYSYIDLNRAGAPLLEIVSEPDLRSSSEVYAFISAIQQVVQYLGISKGDMEKGELRCDCNVSVRKKGDPKLGERCEIKNLNSRRFARRAVELEALRQIDLLKSGQIITNQTLRYDPQSNRIIVIREKETAHDYRYFPEPDIPPFRVTEAMIQKQQAALPALPEEIINALARTFNITLEDAVSVSTDQGFADYLLKAAPLVRNNKLFWTIAVNKIRPWLKENDRHPDEFPVTNAHLAAFAEMIDSGMISQSRGLQTLFPLMLSNPDSDPEDLANKHDLLQRSDQAYLVALVESALAKYPDKAKLLAQGKTNLLGLFMGEVMRNSGGKANPGDTRKLILEAVKNLTD